MGLSSKVSGELAVVSGETPVWKKIRMLCLFSCFLILGSAEGKAQTFAEWFAQGSTLIKYLGTQIAYLELYEHGLKAGYNEAKGDLGLINNFKDGELGLHSGYYTSLKQVSPAVRVSTDFGSIQPEVMVMEQQFSGLRGLSGLTDAELAYVNSVGSNVMRICDNHLEELSGVLASGTLAMTDEERVKKVREIASLVKEAYVFSCTFCAQVRLLAASRLKDGQEASGLDKLYGISQ